LIALREQKVYNREIIERKMKDYMNPDTEKIRR